MDSTESTESKNYTKLKSWVEDSLDQFKQELMQVLYPIFIHTYFDLIATKKDFRSFFEKHRNDFKKDEMIIFASFSDLNHIKENSLSLAYRTEKFVIGMGKYAFSLLINFLEDNDLNYVLKLINQYIDIKIGVGQKKEIDGLVCGTNEPVNLTTFLVSNECEECILKDEKYKYDHLETLVIQFRKKRENKNTGYPASYIAAEIEKLKDITKRITCNSKNLPSICCYTVNNTFEELCCSEISHDSKIISLGFKSGVIEIHPLDGMLNVLKTSSELEKCEIKEQFVQKESMTLVGHHGAVYSTKFFKSCKNLVSCSQDCTVRVWSLELFSTIFVIKLGFPVWCVDVSRDFYIAAGSADRVCAIYSILMNKPERIFTALSDVTAVKFHPNGLYVFFGSSDSYIRMVDIQTSKVVRVFAGHTEQITCLDVSHCGEYLCSGSKDKSVIMWDISGGKIIQNYKHCCVVWDINFCWFGSIICAVAGGCVKIFDYSDPRALATFNTKNSELQCCRFGYRNILSVIGPSS